MFPSISFVNKNGCVSSQPLNAKGYICNCPIQDFEKLAIPKLEGIVALLLYFILILLFGKFLWNEVLVKLFNGVNKAKSIWDILGFAILLALLLPACK